MEIRIDTAKDSKEDILKAIEFLQKIVEGGGGSFEVKAGENVMGSLFDQPSEAVAEEPSAEQAQPAQMASAAKAKEKQRFDGLELY